MKEVSRLEHEIKFTRKFRKKNGSGTKIAQKRLDCNEMIEEAKSAWAMVA